MAVRKAFCTSGGRAPALLAGRVNIRLHMTNPSQPTLPRPAGLRLDVALSRGQPIFPTCVQMSSFCATCLTPRTTWCPKCMAAAYCSPSHRLKDQARHQHRDCLMLAFSRPCSRCARETGLNCAGGESSYYETLRAPRANGATMPGRSLCFECDQQFSCCPTCAALPLWSLPLPTADGPSPFTGAPRPRRSMRIMRIHAEKQPLRWSQRSMQFIKR